MDFRLHWSTATTKAWCQRYKATALSETTPSLLFSSRAPCALRSPSSSLCLCRCETLNAGYLKIIRKKNHRENYRALYSSSRMRLHKELGLSRVQMVYGLLIWAIWMAEGRGSKGREVKYQHWKGSENQLSGTLFLFSRNSLRRFVWEARILCCLKIVLSRKGPVDMSRLRPWKGNHSSF